MMQIDLLVPKFASYDNGSPFDEVTKEGIKDAIRNNFSYYETLYGYDYVDICYKGINETNSYRNLSAEIERISFELDFEEEYGTETSEIYNFDDEDDYIEEDDDFLEDLDDDFDLSIFDDPVLMVKWLENKQRQADEQDVSKEEKQRQTQFEDERKERERVEVERREQEHLEAERKEHERIEAERRQQELNELNRKHSAELLIIKQKYDSELSVVKSEIFSIKRRLSEIEERIAKLNFLQFGEKKNLKAEQEKLTKKMEKLNSLVQEMKSNFERETNLETYHYNEVLRDLESSFR